MKTVAASLVSGVALWVALLNPVPAEERPGPADDLKRPKEAGADASLLLRIRDTAGGRDAPTQAGLSRLVPAAREEAFVNSLGMKFVPVPGTQVLFCVWETRVRDYHAFVSATGRASERPDFQQTADDPAVSVSWSDAKAFCAWLGQREGRAYRLPTDHEWSCAVGIGDLEDPAATPDCKGERIKDVYPWGQGWPPPARAGNYGLGDDGYSKTSPVGHFAANAFGLFDVGGNVWEWCEDWLDSDRCWRVVRGGSWIYDFPDFMLSSCRRCFGPDDRYVNLGFRCVVVTSSPQGSSIR